jgi:hypothetical protein
MPAGFAAISITVYTSIIFVFLYNVFLRLLTLKLHYTLSSGLGLTFLVL